MTDTTLDIRIDTPLCELSTRKDIVRKEAYLILSERFIFYKVVADYSTKEEEDIQWKEKKSNYRWRRKRSDITSVEMFYDNPEDKYVVSIDFNGVADTSYYFFEDAKECLKLYNSLDKYFIEQP
jgi:hypothetical protein